MRQTRLPTLLATLALAAVACGTATTSPPGDGAADGGGPVTSDTPGEPATENVPLDLRSVLIAWSVEAGGTPVRKVLTGPAAVRLARDFNRLRVDTSVARPCPMIPAQSGDVVVRFRADGHTWEADIPPCPNIRVSRDGSPLPALAFGDAFLDDVQRYTGDLPSGGNPRGGVVPLVPRSRGQGR